MTLYELTDDYKRLLEMAETEELDEVALADTLEGIQGAIEIKADNYAVIINELKADVDKIDAEIARLSARAMTINNNIDRLKLRLFNAMDTTGNTKFKTERFSFSIVNNGGVQPIKIVGDVPTEFTKTKMVVSNDMDKIRDYLVRYGNTKWAELQDRGRRLSIK